MSKETIETSISVGENETSTIYLWPAWKIRLNCPPQLSISYLFGRKLLDLIIQSGQTNSTFALPTTFNDGIYICKIINEKNIQSKRFILLSNN